ncbi:hypothetical protein PoB_004180300 [Plakobranchus ocellatus]|uniref:SMB domain-containing protein n=1 Tax=Plakobranchus ocellatus TaxID=259542 RepID=A0AAV4B901_9GAST|nr:hypothetical protein PoB_004180300 [Plakobranchus ocellatus]
MVLSNQWNLTTVIIMMATTLFLLFGPLLAISPDLSIAHAGAGSLNTTQVASEFLDNQTNSMDEENYPFVKWKSTKRRTSDLSSSPDIPQILQQKNNSSFLATKETNNWTRESQAHMTKRPGFFEDPTGLVKFYADESLEGEPDSFYGDYGTYNRSMNCSGISSPNPTLKQFEKEYIDTSTDDLTAEPPMNSFKPDSTLTFTCQGRCGKEMSFPCSCSASCVVYGTCCDNMTQDCPQVWEEGMTRFDHMLGADVVCHEDFIYMISSCPRSLRKDAEGKQVTLPTIRKSSLKKVNLSLDSQSPKLDSVGSTSETRDIIEFGSEEFSKSGRNVQESIVERLKLALSAAPVTDTDTGFTFINKSIYDCNNMSQSTALVWPVASEYIAVSPVMLEDLARFDFNNQFRFELDKEIIKVHQCLYDLVETCNQTVGLEEMNQILAEKCGESTTVVTSKLKSTDNVFYRNIFCAYCNQGSHDRYYLFQPNKPLVRQEGFQVLMSLSQSGTINVRMFNPGMSKAILPWSHAHCSIPDPNTELSSSPGLIEEQVNVESDRQAVCSVACQDSYFKSPTDGRCKTQHHALLAIADDGLPPLCPSAMKGLANFLVCGLKSEVKSLSYADLSSPSVSAMFDASTNKTLYEVQINLDLISRTTQFFSTRTSDTIQNIYHVALLVKSFKNYLSPQDLCSRQDLKIQELESELRVIRTSSIEVYLHHHYGMKLSEGMEQLRGPVVNTQDTTTVCLTAVHSSSKVLLNYLRCMDDPERERDKSLLHDFRGSSCFSHLENLDMPDSNGADTVMPRDAIFLKMLVLAFIILVVAFVKTT